MSLINQMLKDLERRRSRDLETSTLSDNITWETPRNNSRFNWLAIAVVCTLLILIAAIGYLLWERSVKNEKLVAAEKAQQVLVKKQQANKKAIRKKVRKKANPPVKVAENEDSQQALATVDDAVDVDGVDDSKPLNLEKKHRPLNKKQQADIAYNKGYQLLREGNIVRGKEYLRQALSLYIGHDKAREMLAGTYIRSRNFVSAAELLSEGVKISPENNLFAKLYARVLLEQNKPKLAIQVLEQGHAAIEKEPEYFALLAATYQRVGSYDKAVTTYLQLVQIHPASGIWWLGLGISLEKSGKNSEAVEAYQRAQKSGSLNESLQTFIKNRLEVLK